MNQTENQPEFDYVEARKSVGKHVKLEPHFCKSNTPCDGVVAKIKNNRNAGKVTLVFENGSQSIPLDTEYKVPVYQESPKPKGRKTKDSQVVDLTPSDTQD